jgi:phosphoribosyl 1,2-cyclic phosphodiesterase
MSLRFASLGSGSEGNALVVEAVDGASATRVLLDCGFSQKEIERRLARLGLEPEQLDAILITHEHGDHIGSGLGLARRLRVPIYMSWGTAQAVDAASHEGLTLHVARCGEPIALRDLCITPYTVPHDAREPLQFTFGDGAARLGVLTDIGAGTPLVSAVLSGCEALVLECNHDAGMLAQSRYPASLKARIAGTLGHLSNDAAAGILAGLDRSRLRHLVGAHLSQQNNTPALAYAALEQGLAGAAAEIAIATQADGFAWRAV